MSGLDTRIFECEGHTFGQIGSWPPNHLDGTCGLCRTRKALRWEGITADRANRDRPHSFLCEGHRFRDEGDLVLHSVECPACQRLREAELTRNRQTAEASKLSPEAERITNAVGAYLPLLVGAGFLALIVWLAIVDPGGLIETVASVLLAPVANVLCLLRHPFGGCY
jgi:hypothetical protein